MIKIRIRDADNEIDIQFPISESALSTKLTGIRIAEDSTSPPFAVVSEVYWPKAFSMLTGRTVNLDELNYLGKRMAGFDRLEHEQFLIGVSKLDSPVEKDLINLTFNLSRFTLCQDVSSYGKIGRAYVLNTEGAVPAHDEDDPKYTAIGKDLIDRGLAQITERGLLIYNPFDPLTEEYDGQTFPPYYYEDTEEHFVIGNSDSLALGDPVKLIGYPNHSKGDSWALLKADFTKKTRLFGHPLYEVTHPVRHGASGGVVLDKEDQIIGLICAGVESMDDSAFDGKQGFIPINTILQDIVLQGC